MTPLLHAVRLSSRALDGSFALAEIPALLARPMLFGLHGRLLLEQEGGTRLFTWRAGRLMGVDGTSPDEGLATFAVRVAGERRRPRIERAVVHARGTGQPLTLALHETGGLDPSLVVAAEQAQARHLVTAALDGGPATAWFERDPMNGVVPSLDGFEALWHGVSEAYDDSQLVALAQSLAGRTRPSDVGIALVRQLAVDPALSRLTVAAQCVTESDQRLLGALILCGLATFVGDPVPAPTPRARPAPEPPVPSLPTPRPTRLPARLLARITALAPTVGLAAIVGAGIGGLGFYLAGPPSPPATLERAETLLLQGAAAEALVLLIEAAQSSPPPEIYRLLGAARAQTGDATGALAAYRAYLDLRPDAPDRAEVERAMAVVRER